MTTEKLLQQIVELLGRLDGQLDAPGGRDRLCNTDWQPGDALRLLHDGRSTRLRRVAEPALMSLDNLLGIDRQKDKLLENTRRFVTGRPANHALLWGARGTGKSSLVRALWSQFSYRGLTLVETDKASLTALPELIDCLHHKGEKLLIYCDDLSFEADEPSYKPLKSALDGSIAAPGERVLIYATSNRRHLLPETHSDNADSRVIDGELHHGDAVEEKVSLSDRFGLWLSFHPVNQELYLDIAQHWVLRFGGTFDTEARSAALRWALGRGGRSGRVAWQFARDWAGG